MATQTILPYPADEIRAAAIECLDSAAAELARLRILFRGHEMSEEQIDHASITIHTAKLRCESIAWSSTRVSNMWPPSTPLP